MFRRTIDSFLGMMLLAVLLPLLILSVIRARLRHKSPAKSRPRLPHAGDPPPASTIGEFQFERAVEAYEGLIDAVLAEKRACATSHK
jgi:hypothetical protein